MNEYCERDGELYYGNDLVATFVPEIKCIDVLKNQVTNNFMNIGKNVWEWKYFQQNRKSC